MKRSFRVATVFTGTAALTGAFGAMAAAAYARDIPVSGDTHQQNCSLDANYVHLYYPAAADHGPDCFGGIGKLSFSPHVTFYGICGGNNGGIVYGYSTGRSDGWKIKFGHGTYSRPFHDWSSPGFPFEGNFRVSALKIYSWSGNDKCPS